MMLKYRNFKEINCNFIPLNFKTILMFPFWHSVFDLVPMTGVIDTLFRIAVEVMSCISFFQCTFPWFPVCSEDQLKRPLSVN